MVFRLLNYDSSLGKHIISTTIKEKKKTNKTTEHQKQTHKSPFRKDEQNTGANSKIIEIPQ